MRALAVLVLVVVAAYAAYCALLYAQQRTMLFPGTTLRAPARGALPARVVSVEIGSEGERIEAWYRAPGSAPGAVVVFAHGNAELIDDGGDILDGFARLGAGVLLVEYPGYGRSAGTPSLASLDAAFEASYDWLAARPEVDPGAIVAMGRSIGTGVAARLATRRPVAALILQSPFTRVADFAARVGVPRFLVRDSFDNLDAVARYAGPVLVMHGRDDDVIPYTMGEAVARASPNARFAALDCAHNDCPTDPVAYWREIRAFLDAHAVLDTPRPVARGAR
ncbi:MAG TPA: alpha/beta hydrolase [Candidatus Saccharimonadia bacterium]|nr:alpha/beta hydrolase [Candidatus Saccharimonadia bacterium]